MHGAAWQSSLKPNPMILPASQAATLALLVISLICWGSWANTLKMAGRWRFELFYYDFAIGFALLAVVAAFTAGSLNSNELTFQENFLITGYRNIAFIVAAGIIFNLGNMLLGATLSVAGMTLAFTFTFAAALVVSTSWNLIFEVPSGMLLSLGGAALLLAAALVAVFTYNRHADAREAAKRAALEADTHPKSSRRASRGTGIAQAVTLSVLGGIALGLFRVPLESALQGDNGVAPYGAALLFAGGIFGSTLIFGPFFFNFPVSGGPIGLRNYFTGTRKQHLLGVLGGILAATGFLTGLLALTAPPFLRTPAVASYALSQGGPALAVLWGLFAWREFKGAAERTRLLFLVMWIIFAAGIGLLAVARRQG
jgi:glucose uptake protein